jgi:hypothetical protein
MRPVKLFLALIVLIVQILPIYSKEVVIRDPKEVVLDNIKGIRIGEPIRYRGISIFPLIHPNPRDRTPYLTLDEAVKKGYLVIKEVEEGTVPKVRVKNKSNKKIFLMAGEIIVGCKQDRVVGSDILIPEKTTLTIPVYCSEQGRWSAKTSTFRARGTNAPTEIRRGIYKKEGQGWIWRKITELQSKLKVLSPTQRLQEVYESEEMKAKYKPYIENLKEFKEKGVVGIVLTIGGKIVCADIFCNETLFAKLYPKLLRSYVVNAVTHCVPKERVKKEDVKTFIKGLFNATYTTEGNPGLGETLRIEGEGIFGKTLLYNDGLIHLSLFQEDLERPKGEFVRPEIRRQILRN